MKNFLESLNDIFSDNYHVFFENEEVNGSGPWMVSDIVFGFTYLKLLDSALEFSKEDVINEYENCKDSENLNEILLKTAVYPSGETLGFYNTCKYDLKSIYESDNYRKNLDEYLESFSDNVKGVLDEMGFNYTLKFLDETNMMLPILEVFTKNQIIGDHYSSYDKFMKVFSEFIKNIWGDEFYTIGREPITNFSPFTSYHYIHEPLNEYGSFLTALLLMCRDFENDDSVKIYDPDSSGAYILEDAKELIEMFKKISGHDYKNVEIYGKSKKVENKLIYLAKKSVTKKDPYYIDDAVILDISEDIFSIDGIDSYDDFNLIVSNYLYNNMKEYKKILKTFKNKSERNTKLVIALNSLDDIVDDLKSVAENDNLESLISFKNHYIIIANLSKPENMKGHFLLIDESDTYVNDSEIDRINRESFSNNNYDIFNDNYVNPLSKSDKRKMKEILKLYKEYSDSEDSKLIENDEYDGEMIKIMLN